MHPDSIPSPAFVLVERWLAEHLRAPSTVVAGATRLPSLTVTELLAAVRTVLAVRPALAQAAHQLSVFDQFRLTLELVRASGLTPDSHPDLAQPAAVMATRRTILCLTRHPGRRRTEH